MFKNIAIGALIFGIGAVCLIRLFILLPLISKHRKGPMAEWGLNLYTPFSYQDEYKDICEKKGYSLAWYKISWGLLISVSFIIIFSFFASVIIFWLEA